MKIELANCKARIAKLEGLESQFKDLIADSPMPWEGTDDYDELTQLELLDIFKVSFISSFDFTNLH